MRGPEREDLIKWVVGCWKSIESNIITNSFIRAGINASSIAEERDEEAEVAQVLQDLDEFDIDNPYLDDLELQIFYNSDLIMDDE
ncbi:MAG: hypothetical protein EOO43_26255 [Flavobacterium sp.]|nr:MAG: hypothetical protein EOO43_26255 [Flavobacterium sp.]